MPSWKYVKIVKSKLKKIAFELRVKFDQKLNHFNNNCKIQLIEAVAFAIILLSSAITSLQRILYVTKAWRGKSTGDFIIVHLFDINSLQLFCQLILLSTW